MPIKKGVKEMKQIGQKYSIAWFNLNRFILRGEREKVLSIYKLLSRSIDDTALNLQLEGDILNAFQDFNALEKYIDSAKIYIKQNRISEAITVYEKISILTNDHNLLEKLLDLYLQNKNHKKIDSLLDAKLNLLLEKESSELQFFLAKLNSINEEYYKKALNLLEKI